MILSVTLSKPVSNIQEILDRPYQKIKISIENSSNGTAYFVQMFTQTQVFHQHFTEAQLNDFLQKHEGKTFKNCVKRTETQEITVLSNKKGKITEIKKDIKQDDKKLFKGLLSSENNLSQKKKNYILQEGNPVPFLVMTGIMTAEGKVISSKYDKFRQINRFLEFINDVIPEILKTKNENEPVRIVDFGCGKSYLTFAVHYFLTQIKNLPCKIEGLDLKEDVINYCNDMAKKLNLENLVFKKGNIQDYSEKDSPDMIITLHACDTATDFALKYAVEKNTKVILSVPCCQHEINSQLQKNKTEITNEFSSLLKWGIIQEKFSSLVTDALRGEWLESKGYKVQMLEFIDMEHTPKNILIRAIKNSDKSDYKKPELLDKLSIAPTIWN